MEAVDIALVLAVDSSGSISNEDFALQFRGYAQGISSAGKAINGPPIVGSEPDIAAYHSRNVIGGEAAFITVAKDISSLHTAVPEKFVTEIAQIGAQSRSG